MQTSARFSCKSTKLMKQKLLWHEILPFLKIQLVLKHRERHESGTGWAGALDTAAAPHPAWEKGPHRTRPLTPGAQRRGDARDAGLEPGWAQRGDPAAEGRCRTDRGGPSAPSPAHWVAGPTPGPPRPAAREDSAPAGKVRAARGPTSSPPDGLESTRRPRPPRPLLHEAAAHRARRPPSRAHLLPRRPARAVGSACAPRFPLGLSPSWRGLPGSGRGGGGGGSSSSRAEEETRRRGASRQRATPGHPPLPGAAIPLRRPPPRLALRKRIPLEAASAAPAVGGRGTGRGGRATEGRTEGGGGRGDCGAGRARGEGHGTRKGGPAGPRAPATSAAPPFFAAEGREGEDFALALLTLISFSACLGRCYSKPRVRPEDCPGWTLGSPASGAGSNRSGTLSHSPCWVSWGQKRFSLWKGSSLKPIFFWWEDLLDLRLWERGRLTEETGARKNEESCREGWWVEEQL